MVAASTCCCCCSCTTTNEGNNVVCAGMVGAWKEKSSAACFQSNLCAGMAPVVGDAKKFEEEWSGTGESSSSAGLSPGGMEK
uniref:Uncharacterized protein n=1 Tax=Zea mays TaxID=4577 RepID=A0A804RHZ6_MAIZE